MAAYQRLLPHFDPEIDLSVIAWSFKVLRYPRLNQGAALDAADADLIIFTTHLCEESPVEIEKWIEAWIPQKRGQPGALIALLGAGRPASSRVCNYRLWVATGAGMGFLPQKIQPAKDGTSPLAGSNYSTDQMAFEGYGLND